MSEDPVTNTTTTVDDTTEPKISPQMQALVDQVEQAKVAMEVANDAPAVEIEMDGKPVKHLHIRLSSHETLRVMALPLEERAKMATHILKERRLASHLRSLNDKATAVAKRGRKTKRKAKAKARRPNR